MAHKIDQDACIGCGSCAGTCPVGAISEDNGKYKVMKLAASTASLAPALARLALSLLNKQEARCAACNDAGCANFFIGERLC